MSYGIAIPRAARRSLLDGLVGHGPVWVRAVNGLGWLGLVVYVIYFSTAGAHAGDAHAYWSADLSEPYSAGVNEEDAYLYAPAFLQALAPLKLLPWEAFFPAWTALNVAVLGWTVGPILAVILLVPGPYSPVWVNLWYGNIAILMAAALVLAFRWAGAWSFLILTKVTPAVGLAWFVARREWGYLLRAMAVLGAVVAISFVLVPGAWFEWPRTLADNSARPELFPLPPLWMRLVAATAIAGLGGWFGARWTVPLAAVLAQPVFWYTGFTMFVAWLGLVRHRPRRVADS
jgi:glycosyl transferase family 87